MSDAVKLDVLVVYSATLATSSSVDDSYSEHPFKLDSSQANCNLSYEYFLEVCKKNGMKAGLTTSSDVIGPGTCSTYWTSNEGKWSKIVSSAKSSQIFDKISPNSSDNKTQRNLLLSHSSIKPFNDSDLSNMFCDKLKTYQQHPEYSIPTVALKSSSLKDINASLKNLSLLVEKHIYSEDFSKKVILKDRFGAGGNHVYKINRDFVKRINALMLEHKEVTFVLQPFLLFEKGYAYKNIETATDIRLIFHNDTLLQAYVRMAKPADFLCNEHQGGQLEYIKKSDVPTLIRSISKKIVKKMNKPKSLYALDFVISDEQRVYFMEGNAGPGLDWDVTKEINEKMSKELIRSIVDELSLRVKKTS